MIKRNTLQYDADLRTKMLETIPRVYLNNAPESKTFPYAVYEVRSIGQNRLVIEIDLWGKKGAEVTLAGYADSLEASLDGYIISNEYHSSIINTNNDFKWVTDPDENLIRINYSFNATYQA